MTTFLYVGEETYVREPQPGLEDFFDREYEEHTALPDGAIDTGFRRGGDRLWLAADKASAYVGVPDDVEAWPRTVQPLGCA